MSVLTRTHRLFLAIELREASTTTGLYQQQTGKMLPIDPQIEFTPARSQRNINQRSLTQKSSLSGVRIGTARYGLEMVGGTFPAQFGNSLRCCSFVDEPLGRFTIGAVSGTFRHGERVDQASSGAWGTIVSDVWDGDAVLWVAQDFQLGAGVFDGTGQLVGASSGATATQVASLSGNTINYSGSDGVRINNYANDSGSTASQTVTLSNNTIHGSGSRGVYIRNTGYDYGAATQQVTLSGNSVRYSGGVGVRIHNYAYGGSAATQTVSLSNNTISNNTRHGILVTGTSARSTEIYGNRIGVAAICIGGCSTTFGNANDGIRVHNGATDAVIQDNTIRFNGQDGVVITGDAVRIAVFKNNITDHPEQAIDLSDNGASGNTNNSVPPPPGSGNFSQNRPSMISAIGQGNTSLAAGVATGALNSSNGTYRIDFYAAVDCPPLFPLGTASPQTWLGATYATISNGTANTDGSASFTGIIGVAGDPDFFATPREIAATATRLATSSTDSQPRSTSEVSSCVSFDARLLSDGFE